jgi:tetratricopeptide (TPR) repeat protein
MPHERPVTQWADRLRQQRLNNARVWLEKLTTAANPAELAIREYSNLLRALETAVADPAAFDLGFNLIEALYPYAFNSGDWERWLHYLEQALHQSQALGRQHPTARLHDKIGDLQRYMGRVTVAETSYQQAHSQYQALGDNSRQANLLVKLGSLYGKQGRVAECQTMRRQAEVLCPLITDKTLKPLVHLGLSQLFTFEGDWPRVLVEAELAADLFRQQGNTTHEVRALNNMALAHMQLGSWNEAEPIMRRVAKMLIAREDYLTLASVKINLGVIAFERQAYQQAETHWQEALQLQSKIKYQEQQPLLLNNLGMVYTRLGEWVEARQFLTAAAQQYKEMGDLLGWANVMDNLADLYEAQGNRAACIAALDQILVAIADSIDKLNDPRYQTIYNHTSARLSALRSLS